jgi:hypothetical protein
MKRSLILAALFAAVLFSAQTALAAKKPKFEGYKKCGGCHKSQKDSWLESAHAHAFDSLKPK